MTAIVKKCIFLLIFIGPVCMTLSSVFGFPYLYALGAFSAWSAFGHLVTLDDDLPGGFSNPDGDQAIWQSSLRQLAIKCAVLAVIIYGILAFPS